MDQSVKRMKLYMDTIKDIHLALRSTASYPEDHPISRGIIGKAYEDLANFLKKQDTVTINIDGKSCLWTMYGLIAKIPSPSNLQWIWIKGISIGLPFTVDYR